MKKVMAGVGRKDEDGVPLFDYVPGEARMQLPLGGSGRLAGLAENLLATYAGRTITVGEISKGHGESSLFVEKNYKDALKNLETNSDVTCSPDRENPKRRKNTLADWVKVTFPRA
ncbi:MAG: hypothetical protein IH866_01230 [Chloroflexi bacterium]|nr:hypothetical protein [Chloroflexota bacterium]